MKFRVIAPATTLPRDKLYFGGHSFSVNPRITMTAVS